MGLFSGIIGAIGGLIKSIPGGSVVTGLTSGLTKKKATATVDYSKQIADQNQQILNMQQQLTAKSATSSNLMLPIALAGGGVLILFLILRKK